MVKEAGFGVAVANALDEVKAVADYVTDHPWNRGIEEAIERVFVSPGLTGGGGLTVRPDSEQ